jgi:hypothetical protein
MVVDDHPVWRHGIKADLEASGTAVVVAEASDGGEARQCPRSPAPRVCPLGTMRAIALPASSLDEAIDGHLPTWLPDGFGLVGAWGLPSQGLGADFAAEAVWADDECREIDLTYWNRIEGVSRLPDKPRVGDWFVTDKPGACGNAVLGDARCLWYFTQPESAGIRVQLSVSMMGVSRRIGDAIVRSIAV